MMVFLQDVSVAKKLFAIAKSEVKMKANLNTKFMQEISKIKEPEVFLGVARILKAKIYEDEMGYDNQPVARDFIDIFADVVSNYAALERRKKRELLKILERANKEAINANRTENSEIDIRNEEV